MAAGRPLRPDLNVGMVTVPSRAAVVLLVVVFAALAAVPLVGDTYAIKVATRMIVFAIFAMSLDWLLGYTGLVSFGHAAFFGLSAYLLHLYAPGYDPVNLAAALAFCLAGTGLAAVLIGALVVRTRGIYFIMVTLAFAQMLFYLFHDSSIAGGSDGAYIWVKPALTVAGVGVLDLDDRRSLLWFALGCLAACYLLLVIMLRSPFGEVIQGIKLNEHRMRALGYDTYRYKLVSFVISAKMAGLAGFLFACIDGYVSPQLLGWKESGIGLVIVILGGIGTLYGAVVGAVAFIGVEEVVRDRTLVGVLAERWQMLMGIFVIVVVLLLRNGLTGPLTAVGRRRPAREDEP